MKALNFNPRFDFTRLLSEADRKVLHHSARWRWISSIDGVPPSDLRHAQHAKWVKVRGNTYVPAHREIMLTLRGSAIFFCNDRFYMRNAGTVILLDHHELRDLKGASYKKNFSCLWLHLHDRESLSYNINAYDKRGRHYYELPMHVKSDKSVALIMDAWDQCRADPKDKMCRELLKTQIVSTFMEILGSTHSAPASDHHQIIVSVQEYIRQHLGENLNLHSLARIAGYSPFFFHRLFVKYAGQTPVEYVQAERLHKARELLKLNYTVRAVTESIGFASTSYFNHFFKKHTGLSPRNWSRRALP